MRGEIVLGLLLVLFSGCCSRGKSEQVDLLSGVSLADGDLVFRRGTGIMSRAVLIADEGALYSHVGIVRQVDSVWYVVHAVPGESEFEGDIDRVKIEEITRFFAPDRAARGCIMRWVGDPLAAGRASELAWQTALRGIPFDHRYNLADTSELYCTELVNWVYRQSGLDLSEGRFTHVDIPALKGDYLMPSDLSANRHLKVVFRFPQ